MLTIYLLHTYNELSNILPTVTPEQVSRLDYPSSDHEVRLFIGVGADEPSRPRAVDLLCCFVQEQ